MAYLNENPLSAELNKRVEDYYNNVVKNQQIIEELSTSSFMPIDSVTGYYSDIARGFDLLNARLNIAKQILGAMLKKETYSKAVCDEDFDLIIDTLNRFPAFKNDEEFRAYLNNRNPAERSHPSFG